MPQCVEALPRLVNIGVLVSVSCTPAGRWFVLFLFNLWKNACRCLRKRRSVSRPSITWDTHPGLHPLTADSALPVSCASSLGRPRYRSCIMVPSTYCRVRLGLEKYVSASSSHPGIREERSPASLVMYFRESCSPLKRTAVRSATAPGERLNIVCCVVSKCIRTATSVGHHQSVSLMCVYKCTRLMTNSLSPPQVTDSFEAKDRGEVLPETASLAVPPPQRQTSTSRDT